MRSLTDFLAGLPDIMPIKTRKLVLEGGVLSKAERADIYMRERNWLDLVLEVGPDAAAAILRVECATERRESENRPIGSDSWRNAKNIFSAIFPLKSKA